MVKHKRYRIRDHKIVPVQYVEFYKTKGDHKTMILLGMVLLAVCIILIII